MQLAMVPSLHPRNPLPVAAVWTSSKAPQGPRPPVEAQGAWRTQKGYHSPPPAHPLQPRVNQTPGWLSTVESASDMRSEAYCLSGPWAVLVSILPLLISGPSSALGPTLRGSRPRAPSRRISLLSCSLLLLCFFLLHVPTLLAYWQVCCISSPVEFMLFHTESKMRDDETPREQLLCVYLGFWSYQVRRHLFRGNFCLPGAEAVLCYLCFCIRGRSDKW